MNRKQGTGAQPRLGRHRSLSAKKLFPDPLALINKPQPVERTGNAMTNTTVLIANMAILVGIFLLGFLAKIFPRGGRNAGSKQ